MAAEWNAMLTALGPFQPGYMNMSDITGFYPQGNDARNMILSGYPGSVSNKDSIVSTVSVSSGSSHVVRNSIGAPLAESLPGISGAHPDSARNMIFFGYPGSVSNNDSIVSTVSNSFGSGSSHVVMDSTGAILAESLPGISGAPHDNVAVVEWTAAEQQILQEGLIRYANEPSIMRYIKIAANLRDKTVRDVALRCKWMMGTRRKQDELHHVRKASYMKDKLAMCDAAGYSFPSPQAEQNELACGALSTTARRLLVQNGQVLEQIDANLSSNKLQDNVDLFNCSRKYFEEINVILKKMDGGVSRLPELPPLEGPEFTSDSVSKLAHTLQLRTHQLPNSAGQQNDQWPPPC